MIREQVVITTLNITYTGQVKHFQVKLPRGTKRVIGVELGNRWVFPAVPPPVIVLPPAPSPVLTVKRNIRLGELKLQSCEQANIFFSGEIFWDNNIEMGDFSNTPKWIPKVFTHQKTSVETEVVVSGESTIIMGIYKDKNTYPTDGLNYQINVYLWYERIEPKQEPTP